MTRHYVTSSEVPHLWAHQSQDWAKGGNLSFEGLEIKSYWLTIGRMFEDEKGKYALVLDSDYSITTRHHCHLVRRALGYGKGAVIENHVVPSIGESYIWQDSAHMADLHRKNAESLIKSYSNLIAELKRKRDFPSWFENRVQDEVFRIKNYINRFDIPITLPDADQDWESVVRHHDERRARNNTPAKLAAKARANERKAEKLRDDYINCRGDFAEDSFRYYRHYRRNRHLEDIFTTEDKAARTRNLETISKDKLTAWYNGNRNSLPTDLGCRLRTHGQEIETSWGARFPVEHGKKAFPLIARVKSTGQSWQPNGHAVHLGHYQITSIDADGTVRAGCHTVLWPEIERLAKELGIAKTEESTA